MELTCSVDGCERSGKLRRGWCRMHYARWQKRGDVGGPEPMRGDADSAFTDKIGRDGSGCIIWLGGLNPDGYGRFYVDGGCQPAHRWNYERHVGPVPDGLVLDHLCRNRACVNPAHLEPVTNRENIARGVGLAVQNARKAECSEGHLYSGDNLRVGADGRRHCRACARKHTAAYRARRALAKAAS